MTAEPSAAPVREPGLRSRAGNAMGRTRAAVLDGAARAVASAGARKTTMADIAAAAGIAKGTLYNHFRTKEAVFAAAVEAGVEQLADEAGKLAAESGLAAGLAHAADRVAGSAAVARLRDEPAALLPLLRAGDGRLWDLTRECTARLLAAGGGPTDPAAVDLALRWLLSFLAAPPRDGAGPSAALLAAGLAEPAPTRPGEAAAGTEPAGGGQGL